MIITILILLYSYLASKLFFVGIFVIFVLLKFNKKKILPLLVILLLVSHPCFHHYPDVNEAYIIDIKPGYAIGICQFQKVIIYHDTDLNYDSVISFSNDYDLIPSNSHFFSFDSGSNYHRQNIHYQINAKNIVVKKQYFSLRSLLYKYSNSYIKKFVFNINDDNNILDGFVNSGFSFIGFIYLVRVILKPYIKDEIYRDYGILTNCYKISSEEAIEKLTKVKMGLNMGVIEIDNPHIIDQILNNVSRVKINKMYGNDMDCNHRDICRAEYIRNALKEN